MVGRESHDPATPGSPEAGIQRGGDLFDQLGALGVIGDGEGLLGTTTLAPEALEDGESPVVGTPGPEAGLAVAELPGRGEAVLGAAAVGTERGSEGTRWDSFDPLERPVHGLESGQFEEPRKAQLQALEQDVPYPEQGPRRKGQAGIVEIDRNLTGKDHP